MPDVLSVARSAAQRAGQWLVAEAGKVALLRTKTGVRDLLTRADLEAERLLIADIHAAFPEHPILAEESGRSAGSPRSSYCWVLDPLDGTTNYLHHFSYCCVSVACMKNNELIAAAIYAPFQEELYLAERGAGATLNGQPIQVSDVAEIENSLLATGFPTSPDIPLEPHLRIFGRILQRAQGVRRPGAAALNLAYVACGRFDAFWGPDLKPWDIAAGMLLVQEGGGRNGAYGGRAHDLFPTQLVASNGVLHDALQELLDS